MPARQRRLQASHSVFCAAVGWVLLTALGEAGGSLGRIKNLGAKAQGWAVCPSLGLGGPLCHELSDSRLLPSGGLALEWDQNQPGEVDTDSREPLLLIRHLQHLLHCECSRHLQHGWVLGTEGPPVWFG